MKRWPAVAVAAVLVGLISTPGMSATSADQKVVREAVVTTAAPDGSPQSTLVSQLVQLSSKDGSDVSLSMPKVADLSSYRNLSGFSGPSGNAKNVVWHTTGSIDAQALAKINRQLPFEVHVKYFLNGKQVNPNQVNGKDGRLKLQIELVNASGNSKDLSYSGLSSPYLSGTVEEYIPFEYAVRVTFPQHSWTGITGKRFDVAPLGTDQVASATGVLSPPLTDVSDTIDVSAHSGDMLRPKIEVYAFPKINPNLLASLQTQYDALKALYGGTGDISKNLEALYNGTVQLVNGLQLFMGGTGQLDSGIGKIVAGVGSNNPTTGKPNITLDKNGQPNTLVGGIGFIADALATAVLPGIGARDPKTGKPIITTSGGTPNTVIGALGSIEDAINGAILPAIGTRDKVTGKGVIVLDSLGSSTTLLGGLQGQKNAYDNALIPGAEQAACGINPVYSFCTKAQKALGGLEPGAQQVASAITILLSRLQTNSATNPGFREGLLGIQGGLQQALLGLQSGNPAAPGVQEALLAVSSGLAQVLLGLGTYTGIPGAATQLQTISSDLSALVTRLDGSDVRTTLQSVETSLATLITDVGNVKTSIDDIQTQVTTALGLAPVEPGVVTALNAIQSDVTNASNAIGDTSTAATILGGLQTAKDNVTAVLGNLGTSGGNAADIIPTIQAVNTLVSGLVTTFNSLPSASALVAGVQQAKGGIDQVLDAIGRTVKVATTVALPSYSRVGNVITASANHAIGAVGGSALASGDRLLLKNGASDVDNGIYAVTSTGSASTPFVLTRPSDAANPVVVSGMLVSVGAGSLAGTTWKLTTPNPIDVNTTALTFTQTATPSFLGGAQAMLAGVGSLLTGLGDTTDPANAFTIIGVLKSLQAGVAGGIVPGLQALGGGIHNALWDQPFCNKSVAPCSKTLKALTAIVDSTTTPHELYSTCPGCFDATFTNYDASKGIKLPNGVYVNPAMLVVLRTNPHYGPGILEAFHLFSDGIRDAFPKLVSFDAKNPGLVDGLGLIASGLDTLTKKLQTFDPKDPGLVDGIQQIVAGLKVLGSKLQTFDPSNPGLVDGLQLVQGGIGQLNGGAQQLHSGGQQISQGVFAIDQLGLRVVHGQVGDSGDNVAQDQAALRDTLNKLGGTSTLAKADTTSTTYVFEISAASTATRDNLIRGALISLLLALLVLMARRPSMLGL